MIADFKEFMNNVVVEELHPELQSVVKSKSGYKSKQTQVAKTIKSLTSRGERTGIEGNMPKGSSRAYLKHDEPHHAIVDGKPASFHTGTKIAIKSPLDRYHNHREHDGMSLGHLQNHAENGDHYVDTHRVLLHDGDNHFRTNHEGIFPPLVSHDHEHHEWAQVGHVENINHKQFQNLTKTESHPSGITHGDFVKALVRRHDKNNGAYWHTGAANEKHLDHVDSHPLTQAFHEYHGNTGNPPHDLGQIKNMGVFHHPSGSKHIVARDHGFSTEVQQAYKNARKKQAGKYGY